VPIRALLSEYPTRRASDVCLRAAQGILDALPPRFVPTGEREIKAIAIIAERLSHGDTDGFSLCWHLEQAGIVHGCSKLVAALEMHAESEVDLALEAAIAEWMVRHEPSAEELPPAAPGGWIVTVKDHGWLTQPDGAMVFTCKPSAELTKI
jgi:hypothetical protein